MTSNQIHTSEQPLLEALLDSWDRNNTILVNLLGAIPPGGWEAKALNDSKSVAEMFTHMHYVRLVFVSEDAPEFGSQLPEEWTTFQDANEFSKKLNESAETVRAAVKSRFEQGRGLDLHFDHPILFLQHLIWHEGYHHGQIKLALKAAGHALKNEEIGPLSWRVWMNKTRVVT